MALFCLHVCEVARVPGIGIADSCDMLCHMLGIEPRSSGRAPNALRH